LVAKRLRKSEEEVQAMAESQDSLDRVELVVAVEEVLGLGLRDDDG
jgi:acyl carrier protein